MRAIFFYLVICCQVATGQEWSVAKIANLGRFDDTYFVNDDFGVTGQKGVIFTTIDKGNTWLELSKHPNMQYIQYCYMIP
jgi:photosystem II stability/assembly factor-like uncharacterized protein